MVENLLRFHTSEAVAPVSAILDHWDARGSSCPACRNGVPPRANTRCHLPVSPTRRWEDAGPSAAWGWSNHRMLLQCEGFIQLLLAASMSSPGMMSALPCNGSWTSSGVRQILSCSPDPHGTLLLPHSYPTPLCCGPSPLFSRRDQRPFRALCKPAHSEMWVTLGWASWKARGQRWQGAGWQVGGRQGSSWTPHLVTQYFQKQAGRQRKRHPCEVL